MANSPLDFQLVLNVVGADARPRPLPTPEGLIFETTEGGAQPQAQIVSLPTGAAGNLVFQASAATTDGADWLSVSPQTGTLSSTNTAQTTVAVKTAGLSPGIYRGVVAYAYHFFGLRTVNVTLIVQPAATPRTQRQSTGPLPNAAGAGCSPTQLVPAPTGLVTNFSSPTAWPTPMSTQLLDDCAQPVINGQVTATFSNGDPPLIFTLTDATAAIYTATWTPRRTGSQVTVSERATAPGFAAAATTLLMGEVTPNAVPVLNHNATLNVFNPIGGAPMAPGTVAEIFGSNLATGTVVSSNLPLPTTVLGTSVIIGGLQVPILYLSPGQVNVQVPFELAPGQPYQVVISANGSTHGSRTRYRYRTYLRVWRKLPVAS